MKELACMEGNFVCSHGVANYAAARNFLNSLERIPQTIGQFQDKNAMLARDIQLLKEIAGKQWKKEDELKGLKSELAAIDRKIQLELAKDNEPEQEERKAVANGDVIHEIPQAKGNTSRGVRP